MVQLLCATITRGRDIYAGDNKHASACPSCSPQAASIRWNTYGKLILANADWSQLHRGWGDPGKLLFSNRQLDCFSCLRLACGAQDVRSWWFCFYFDTWEPASYIRLLGHAVLGRHLYMGKLTQPWVAPLFLLVGVSPWIDCPQHWCSQVALCSFVQKCMHTANKLTANAA